MLTKEKLDITLTKRLRRLRSSAAMRALVAETHLQASDFIAPFFVVEGRDEVQPIATLPGVSRYSVDTLLRELERTLSLGVRAVMLFGVVPEDLKTPDGQYSSHAKNPVNCALNEARQAFGQDLVLMTDVCLCGYTTHGHCGLLKRSSNGIVIDNDSSLGALTAMALSHAVAGADIVAPSDMMDGRVQAIRRTLDSKGFGEVGILSYAVKYASAFYGPFRDAAGSAPSQDTTVPKNRKTYQMDMRNVKEALREAELDEAEGSDMLMVKPALGYLDVLAKLREETRLPLVAYNVSGEYAMLKAAAAAEVLDEASAVQESLTSIKRSGADLIISYHALEALEQAWL